MVGAFANLIMNVKSLVVPYIYKALDVPNLNNASI